MYVIVRHGNTFAPGEPPRRIGARTDLALTEAGITQAHALAAHFIAVGWRFARALVSPLSRTRETARLILDRQADGIVPQTCDWLAEIDHGPDENATEEAVLARIGHAALIAWDRRAEPPPGWTVDAEARRAGWRALFADVQARAANGPTLIVTSNGAARFALLADPALAAAAVRLPSLKLATGAYGVLRRGPGGALRIADWDRRP